MTFLLFSRGFEAQADFLGVQYMYRAGYDPQAFVTIFEKLENLEKTKPNLIAKAFSSHPQTPDRIEATQKEIATRDRRERSTWSRPLSSTMSRLAWRALRTSVS